MRIAEARKAVEAVGFDWWGVDRRGIALEPLWVASAGWQPPESSDLMGADSHDFIDCAFTGATRTAAAEKLVAFCRHNKKPNRKGTNR
jgi:hypothetical protein